jgi:hypothetical protein
MPTSSSDLRRKRKTLVQSLPPLIQASLRGSLIERYLRCGKPGCHCMTGRGHGPKYYLSVSYPKRRPQMQYIPQEQKEAVEALLKNGHAMRETLEKIFAINQELVKRQEPP